MTVLVSDRDDVDGLPECAVDNCLGKAPNQHASEMIPDWSAGTRVRQDESNGSFDLHAKRFTQTAALRFIEAG
jgi:hypothetical protein